MQDEWIGFWIALFLFFLMRHRPRVRTQFIRGRKLLSYREAQDVAEKNLKDTQ